MNNQEKVIDNTKKPSNTTLKIYQKYWNLFIILMILLENILSLKILL